VFLETFLESFEEGDVKRMIFGLNFAKERDDDDDATSESEGGKPFCEREIHPLSSLPV